MVKQVFIYLLLASLAYVGCKNKTTKTPGTNADFDPSLVKFKPSVGNPVFTHGQRGAWDEMIRERGFILYEDTIYKMWYTGYKGTDTSVKYLGYATSKDGRKWQRHPANPVYTGKWTEDVYVFKHEGRYHMYAEGVKDVAHLLTSDDGITWREEGDLVIINTRGDTLPGPYGTPTVFIEDGKWYLFYEINDSGIWIATSTDKLTWKNISDEPVLKPGPEKYDLGAVAVNQVVKHKGKYYLYYHASADPGWATNPGAWNSNAAISNDLIKWKKYPGNPIVEGDHSSPIVVMDAQGPKLYTMHPDVWLFENE